ncbi:peptidylprolyl isomerase [Bacteroidota bacterium]
MKIAKNTVPSVTYSINVDGEVIDQADKSNPLTFLMGAGSMIPGFERQLEGLSKGDSYQFTVQPEEGYGDIDQDVIVDIPKNIFIVEGELKDDLLFVGNSVPMQDNQGNPLEGIILEIGDDTVKMDFNHQLAGKVLDFSGEIIDVREAAEEEISHGHIHGPGDHHH